jgi:cell wall-associated NlpC family hydrolase
LDRRPRHTILCALAACLAVAVALPAGASAQAAASGGGGAAYVPPPPPAKRAKIVDGVAIPPAGAPRRIQKVFAAANRIVKKPYVYGGGHKPYRQIWRKLDRGYDCSGTVSHALYGGKFLTSPLDSGSFMSWGERGPGRWITVYTNPGHAYVVIGGLRLDTSSGGRATIDETRSGDGPRWRTYNRSPRGFTARHPSGF